MGPSGSEFENLGIECSDDHSKGVELVGTVEDGLDGGIRSIKNLSQSVGNCWGECVVDMLDSVAVVDLDGEGVCGMEYGRVSFLMSERKGSRNWEMIARHSNVVDRGGRCAMMPVWVGIKEDPIDD